MNEENRGMKTIGIEYECVFRTQEHRNQGTIRIKKSFECKMD
jgi:hypothetical protein